jgi:uncharacterized membrane protein
VARADFSVASVDNLMVWLAFAYPVLVHVGVWLHSLLLQWIALVCLLIAVFSAPLKQRRVWAWSALVCGATALYLLIIRGHGMYALYLPPIAIPLLIFWLFARSLRSGATPLVSQIAETMRGNPLPEVLRAYTRHVTQWWCAIAIGLMISAIVSAIWASPELWSTITNVIHYLIMGVFFVLEFAYRRVKYAELEPWGLVQYLKRLTRARIRI